MLRPPAAQAEPVTPGGGQGRVASQWTEPYPRLGLLVTNLACPPESVAAFSKQCGTVEQWIRERENAAEDRVKQRVASRPFVEPIRAATLPWHVN